MQQAASMTLVPTLPADGHKVLPNGSILEFDDIAFSNEREITVAGVTNLLLFVYKCLYQTALETSLL